VLQIVVTGRRAAAQRIRHRLLGRHGRTIAQER
jgi:hypothetical protein